jgi:hypothetical protein
LLPPEESERHDSSGTLPLRTVLPLRRAVLLRRLLRVPFEDTVNNEEPPRKRRTRNAPPYCCSW